MIKLFPYQEKTIEMIQEFDGRCVLASSMGTGKTATALSWAVRYKKFPCVIVCPASLKWMWQNEASRHFNRTSEVLESMKPLKKRIEKYHKIIIINYTILGPWLPLIKTWNPKLVIIDECSAICNRQTKQSKNVKLLCEGVPHVIALSGTPLTNRPAELWPVLNIVRPDLYPKFWAFSQKHCLPKRMPWGWTFNGAVKLDILHSQLKKTMMIRFLKEDVLKDLPKKQRIVVPMAMDNPKEYQDALRDFIRWLTKKNPAQAKKASRAEQLVKIGYLRRLAGELKLKNVFNWVDDFLENSDGKLILFAIHKNIIRKLEERYKKICVVVDGSVKGKDRQTAVDTFQNDKRCRVFVGNVKAAGMGITLTSASNLAFVEIGWTPGEMSQAGARCIAKGTPVLTPKGWIPIENIQLGDKVIAHSGKQRTVVDTWSKGADRFMADVEVTGSLWTLSTTWDHRYKMRNGTWKKAGDLRPGDQLAMIGNPDIREVKRMKFNGERINKQFINNWGTLQTNANLKKAPSIIDVTDDFLFTVGYFAGDGYTSSTRSSVIGICGNDSKKQQPMEIVNRWMNSQEMTGKPYQKKGEHGILTCYYHKEWALWFRSRFGEEAVKKRLPSFALKLNPRQSQIILNGLAESDGYRRTKKNKRIEYSTVSKTLAAHVFLLSQRAGYRPTITMAKEKQYLINWGGNEGPRSGGIVKTVFLRNKRKINGLREQVYDLTVDGDESFVIGTVPVHNCDRIGQTQEMTEYWLIAKGSIEEKMCSIIQKKQKVLDATLDGKYGNSKSDLDIFDLLSSQLLKDEKPS